MSFYNLVADKIVKTLIIKDKATGKSKGYGYLELTSRSLVKKCLEKREPLMLSKRALIVRDAQKKFEHSKHANEPRKREKK